MIIHVQNFGFRFILWCFDTFILWWSFNWTKAYVQKSVQGMVAQIVCQSEVLAVERSTKEKWSFFLQIEINVGVCPDPKQWINSAGRNEKPLEWLSLSNQNNLLFIFSEVWLKVDSYNNFMNTHNLQLSKSITIHPLLGKLNYCGNFLLYFVS